MKPLTLIYLHEERGCGEGATISKSSSAASSSAAMLSAAISSLASSPSVIYTKYFEFFFQIHRKFSDL